MSLLVSHEYSMRVMILLGELLNRLYSEYTVRTNGNLLDHGPPARTRHSELLIGEGERYMFISYKFMKVLKT